MKARGLALGACALLALALACGCGGKDRNPEGAVELFVRAAQEADPAEVFRLLAPGSQRELQERARLANAQAAGRRVRPEDLLAVGRELPRFEVTRIRALSVEGDRAVVEISDLRKGASQRLTLARVEQAWRVVLPPGRPVAPPPAALPATRPASQPASHPASQPASRPAGSP